MKGLIVSLSLAAALLVCSGCATMFPVGVIFTDATLPMSATSASGASKDGQATCTSILAIFATGDCS